jgi:glucuronate isomerase
MISWSMARNNAILEGLMMTFIHDDFLLDNDGARELYHEYAKDQSIIDYHCHLNPKEIAEDLRWENISQIWLAGDHYKWRAMRSNGISEEYCTGARSDREKYDQWAATVPYLLRNPLYHWTHLELARYFDVGDLLLSPKTADEIWERTSVKIQSSSFSARSLIKKSKVKVICTTDDPIDDLVYHRQIDKDSSFECQVLPTWRPDRAMAVEHVVSWNEWVDRLAVVANVDIDNFDHMLTALRVRHQAFHDMGCRLSDHGIEECYGEAFSAEQVKSSFAQLRQGESLGQADQKIFKSAMMYHFAVMDHEKSWTQQIHYGALRNNNMSMHQRLGPDIGFDSIGNTSTIKAMSKMLNRQDLDGALPKTIIYNLNPADNECVATMLGNFQDGSVAGKMQMGSGWWFLDQKDGMERQMESLSQLGLLSRFVGMLTDSRSFLSYTRHEYFRRILCNLLGKDMEKGLIPKDMNLVGGMVENICYQNAKDYFQFPR